MLATMDKLLVTPREAADVLGVGRSKVYELLRNGTLASVRIGASRRIPVDALAVFVNNLQAVRAGDMQLPAR
jgi:excisionase family DNA binding protein